MKGDFSRSTFDPAKGYSSVRMQQGRVQLDADWNEQIDIQNHLQRRALADAVGPTGVPQAEPDSFRVRFAGGQLVVDPGRIWIDGRLCETSGAVATDPVPSSGTHLAYLEAWERHVTAIEDPSIREAALGGPDTATRTQTAFRVRFAPLDDAAVCADPIGWTDPTADGALTARFQAGSEGEGDPCLAPADAGFSGLENQLYRVEVHQGGTVGQDSPTFKWSRDNGAVATPLLDAVDRQLTIAETERDSARGFRELPLWVEVSDDDDDFAAVPGQLAEVVSLGRGAGGEVLLGLDEDVAATDPALHPRVRRWDGPATPIAADEWIDLENGVQVQFSGTRFRAGDYWLIPARTFIGDFGGDVEWPDGEARAPQGVERRIAKLAVVRPAEQTVEDCRQHFLPLTQQQSSTASGISYDPGCTYLENATNVQEALDALCLRDDTEEGIKILGVESDYRRIDLQNDRVILREHFLYGIDIRLDREIDARALSSVTSRFPVPTRPIVYVNLYLPYPLADASFWGGGTSIAGFHPIMVAGTIEKWLKTLIWKPTPEAFAWFKNQLFPRLVDQAASHLLVELNLRGNYLWEAANDPPQLYVDGDSFGLPSGGTIPRVDLSLPTGDGRRGGDFRMWFWLYVPEEVTVEVLSFGDNTSSIVGRVLDPVRDQPHVGKNVDLCAENSQGDEFVFASDTTDAFGSYNFSGLLYRSSGYRLRISKVGGTEEGYDFDRSVNWTPTLLPTDVSGIGPKLAGRLAEHEITTADQLARTEPARLSEILRVSPQRAEAFVERARELTERAESADAEGRKPEEE